MELADLRRADAIVSVPSALAALTGQQMPIIASSANRPTSVDVALLLGHRVVVGQLDETR